MKFSCGLLAGVMLTLAVPVCAQSPRRARQEGSGAPQGVGLRAAKIYTNDDLKKITPPIRPRTRLARRQRRPRSEGRSEGRAAKDQAAKDPATPRTTRRARQGRERTGDGRITAAREDVRRSEMFRDALQTRINGPTADFTAATIPAQRAQIADDRQKALAELTA